MNSKKGFTLIALLIAIAIVSVPWVWNAAKFASCDFVAPYKCEVLHGTGILVPPASFITVWFADDGAQR